MISSLSTAQLSTEGPGLAGSHEQLQNKPCMGTYGCLCRVGQSVCHSSPLFGEHWPTTS